MVGGCAALTSPDVAVDRSPCGDVTRLPMPVPSIPTAAVCARPPARCWPRSSGNHVAPGWVRSIGLRPGRLRQREGSSPARVTADAPDHGLDADRLARQIDLIDCFNETRFPWRNFARCSRRRWA